MKSKNKKIIAPIIILIIILAGIAIAIYSANPEEEPEPVKKEIKMDLPEGADIINKKFYFSEPMVKDFDDSVNVYVNETNLNAIGDGRPILPVNLTVFEFPFGTEIIDIQYLSSNPKKIEISKNLSCGSYSPKTAEDPDIYNSEGFFPYDWVIYHKGGGLYKDERKTFLALRVYPVLYEPINDTLHYIDNIEVQIGYKEPDAPPFKHKNQYDLLVVAPKDFQRKLNPLIKHKNDMGVKTVFETIENAYKIGSEGRDNPEKLKYYIKNAVEEWGIKYVLLVGGVKGQTTKYNIPFRYSHVVPPKEQEYPEQSFITDLYFADLYDSEGVFSSWNTNNNDIFAEWNEEGKDEMDLYPDVYVGRLPCRNTYEVKTMVDKIIKYETGDPDSQSWFDNLLLVAGDSYEDENQYNEGEMITEKALELMPGSNPIRVYASLMQIEPSTINKNFNKGSGLAYFCGHGSAVAWGTHYPPDGTKWTTFYDAIFMNFLRNKNKYPVAVIGGCLNGKCDMSIQKNIQTGLQRNGVSYFFKSFPKSGWRGHCWAWKLTVKRNGGAIATISNTGLGTHGRDDNDHNGIIDYLEVINGWQELRFIELYGIEQQTILGENHGQTITEYLHRFNGNIDKMDVKMAQQWFLFGDPSLNIGGY